MYNVFASFSNVVFAPLDKRDIVTFCAIRRAYSYSNPEIQFIIYRKYLKV